MSGPHIPRKRGSVGMGFFGRKKHNDAPASVLSEEEIQKKLYGEFSKIDSPIEFLLMLNEK